MAPIAEAAAFLAAEWAVFPVRLYKAGNKWEKQPLVKWRAQASRDPQAVREMFANPAANAIGVPMGPDAGVFLLDVDPRHGGDAWLEANWHRLPRTRTHRTVSGGLHFLYRWPEGRRVRTTSSEIAPGVDTKCDGGFCVFPPSPNYSIEDDTMPSEAPEWLLDALAPRERPAPAPRTSYKAPHLDGDGTPFGRSALRSACEAIANASDGAKHDTLNREAYSMGGLVSGGHLLESAARAELRNALRAILPRCDDPRAAERTLEQAFRDGMAAPRQIPERPVNFHQPTPNTRETHADPPVKIHQAEAPPPPGLPLVYWNAITPSLGADDFVEGVLISGQMSVIYGPSNCGKTFWASDLAMHVATGRKWNGREIEAGGVIYCALEGAYGIQNRVAAWRMRQGLEGVEVPFAIIPVALNLLDPAADTDRLIDAIHTAAKEMGCPVRWTVMDTLSRAMAGGNENSPEDMGALVTNGTKIQQVTKSHVSWIHHCGKDQAQGARGHSLLRAATDTEIEISRPDKDSPSTAKVTKQREMEIEGEWTFKLEPVELGKNRRGKPVTSCIVVPADKPDTEMSGDVRQMSGDVRRAYEILCNLLAEDGKPGFGAPDGVRSVPADWWRDRFYSEAKPGAEQSSKQKAFRRAADALVGRNVAMHNGRVWVV